MASAHHTRREFVGDRLLGDYSNLYGDFSAGSGLNAITRDPDFARGFLNRHRRRLIWGSDCDCRDGEKGPDDATDSASQPDRWPPCAISFRTARPSGGSPLKMEPSCWAWRRTAMPVNMQATALNIADPETPVGARGVGEPPVGAGFGAVLNAIADAIGVDAFRRAPVTSDIVLMSLTHGKRMHEPLQAHL